MIRKLTCAVLSALLMAVHLPAGLGPSAAASSSRYADATCCGGGACCEPGGSCATRAMRSGCAATPGVASPEGAGVPTLCAGGCASDPARVSPGGVDPSMLEPAVALRTAPPVGAATHRTDPIPADREPSPLEHPPRA